jgi:hypothetical protein
LEEWTTPDFRNTPSATNLEEEEIVDAPGNDGNASMPEQIKRPNPWRKMMALMGKCCLERGSGETLKISAFNKVIMTENVT